MKTLRDSAPKTRIYGSNCGSWASVASEDAHGDIVSGLVSHWKMDDAIVPPVVDATGTNHGICSQCPEKEGRTV